MGRITTSPWEMLLLYRLRQALKKNPQAQFLLRFGPDAVHVFELRSSEKIKRHVKEDIDN